MYKRQRGLGDVYKRQPVGRPRSDDKLNKTQHWYVSLIAGVWFSEKLTRRFEFIRTFCLLFPGLLRVEKFM